MKEEQFLRYVDRVQWRFAKSVPNWPHFYIVEEELADQEDFRAARLFVRESGRDGTFYDLKVRYFDAGGWTYWSSPLAKPFEEQYMLNRCKTAFTYDSLVESGELPVEGFQESALILAPVLEDPEFKSLVRDAKGSDFTVFDVLGTADYEIRHSNVLSWLLASDGSHGLRSSFLELLWTQFGHEHDLPSLPLIDYTVDREGANEDEKIDLLLRAEDQGWVIVIENKLFSPETGDQLDRYFRYIEHRYSDVPHRLYFYLTPDGIGPAREEDSSNWLPVSYLAVKQAVSDFLANPLPDRMKDFLLQYLEHVERNVLKSAGVTERQRSVLKRHAKTLHALPFMLEDKSVQAQCGAAEFNLLKSILAVQQEVGTELYEFTKRMMAKHGYRRYSGLAHWVTIEIPGLREKLIRSGLLSDKDDLPITFAFDSRPDLFCTEVWVYKNKPLYSKTRGRLMRFSAEGPEPNRGDEHLVDVLFRRTIISPEEIVQRSLSELKEMIATYFESDLRDDLAEAERIIGSWADTEQMPNRDARTSDLDREDPS